MEQQYNCPKCRKEMFLKKKKSTLYFYFLSLAILVGFWVESSRRSVSLRENAIWGGFLILSLLLSVWERSTGRKEYFHCEKCRLSLDVNDKVFEEKKNHDNSQEINS